MKKTKQELEVFNQAKFPSNHTEYITAENLRQMHSDLIDSFVDETSNDIELGNLSTAISTEVSDRINGDESLSTTISTEISTRESADESLSTSITTEISNINSSISTESSNRVSGDESLSTTISTEISTRASSDETLSTSIYQESSLRVSADASLSSSIQAIVSSGGYDDTGIYTALSTETSDRINGDESLSTTLSTETSNRVSGDSSLSTLLSTEVSARTSADSSIVSLLSSDYVPYSGANKDVDLGTNDLSVAGIKLNTTTPLVVSNPGEIGWDSEWGTIDIQLLNSTKLQVGQEIHIYGKCMNGETINNGDVVQFAGVQGNHILLKRAIQSEIIANQNLVLGVATQNITSNNYGYITRFGVINDVYTTGWSLGDSLWFDISGSTPGTITNIEPIVPNRKIKLGSVLLLQTGGSESGKIFIKQDFGIKLGDLDDVNGTTPTTGSILEYTEDGYFDFTKNINDYALVSALSTESSTRLSTDSSLSSDISTEVSARTSADSSLSTIISTESSTRLSADSSLSTGLSSEVSARTSADSSLATKMNDYLPLSVISDTGDLSGFITNSDITVTYNYTNRTITLNGSDLSYLFKGVKRTLGNGLTWTSTSHTNTVGLWFLYSTNGIDFVWSQDLWSFKDVMVSFVYYQATEAATIAFKDVHSTMDWRTHQELHSQIGTYLKSGGKLTAGTYIENTTTDVATTPGFDAAVVKDEDVDTSIASLTEGAYTLMYVNATNNTSTFVLDNAFPFIVSAGTTLNMNNTATGAMINGTANRYYNIYQILLPTSIDSASAKYRMIMLQPQVAYTSLTAAQAEDVRTLSLGGLSSIASEFVIYSRITYATNASYANTGKCVIATGGVSYLVGNKMSQVAVSGISGNNHAALANLTWTTSGHIGTANTIPAFDNSGIATEIVTSTLATSSALSTEVSDRVSADNSLSSSLSTESSTRTSADSSLSTSLSTESSTRVSADTSLSTLLSSEISTRTSADASLSTAIGSVQGGGASMWTLLDATRTSNTTFTVTGDTTSTIGMGMIIKWTESSTVRTAMVVSAAYTSLTTVTIIGDTLTSIDANSMKYCLLEAEVKNFAVAGVIGTVATNVSSKYTAEKAYRVIGASIEVGTSGTTNATTIDINKTGTTMFTTKPTLTTTTYATPFTADSGSSLAVGNTVTIDIDAVHTTPAEDLYVKLYLFETRLLNLI